jgi:hypothetical protein
VSVLDGSFADLIPFVFPGAYLAALAVLHVFANVRPSHALLKERYAQLQTPGVTPIAVGRPLGRVSQSEVLAGWRALHQQQVELLDDLGDAGSASSCGPQRTSFRPATPRHGCVSAPASSPTRCRRAAHPTGLSPRPRRSRAACAS